MPGRAITAAGTVVLDLHAGKDPKVLLVHRPAYDDWSLPKGKTEPDEYLPACAVRETVEETGVTVRLGQPLGTIGYTVGGGRKQVHYWIGIATAQHKRRPDKEVDRVAWLSVKAALARMDYGDERNLVDRALLLQETTPFLVVRHAKAMERKNWSGRDQARPLNARGRKQADALVSLLGAYGVRRLSSSTSARCLQTLKPYAKASALDIQGWSTLSEELGEGNDKAVEKLMQRLLHQAADDRRPRAVCGHRPVLPTMLRAVGVQPRPMQTAAVGVCHVDGRGEPLALEWHKPLR